MSLLPVEGVHQHVLPIVRAGRVPARGSCFGRPSMELVRVLYSCPGRPESCAPNSRSPAALGCHFDLTRLGVSEVPQIRHHTPLPGCAFRRKLIIARFRCHSRRCQSEQRRQPCHRNETPGQSATATLAFVSALPRCGWPWLSTSAPARMPSKTRSLVGSPRTQSRALPRPSSSG